MKETFYITKSVALISIKSETYRVIKDLPFLTMYSKMAFFCGGIVNGKL